MASDVPWTPLQTVEKVKPFHDCGGAGGDVVEARLALGPETAQSRARRWLDRLHLFQCTTNVAVHPQ